MSIDAYMANEGLVMEVSLTDEGMSMESKMVNEECVIEIALKS